MKKINNKENYKEEILKVKSHDDANKLAKKIGVNLRTIYKWKKDFEEKNEILSYVLKLEDDPELLFPNEITAERISNKFDISINKSKQVIELALQRGVNLYLNTIPKIKRIPKEFNIENDIKIGIVADTHLNSYWERLDLLNLAYDYFEKEGIRQVIHAGNIIDGVSKFNMHEIKNIGIDSQIKYLIDNYPKRKNIKTFYIVADEHESWASKNVGLNIGTRIQNLAQNFGRDDLEYIGYIEGDIVLHFNDYDYIIRVIHPGKGVTKGLSLRYQQLVDDMDEDNRPDMLIVGHYHKLLNLYYKGVYVIGVPSFQERSRFMKKQLIQSNLGFYTLTIKSKNHIILDIQYFKSKYNNNYKGFYVDPNNNFLREDKLNEN